MSSYEHDYDFYFPPNTTEQEEFIDAVKANDEVNKMVNEIELNVKDIESDNIKYHDYFVLIAVNGFLREIKSHIYIPTVLGDIIFDFYYVSQDTVCTVSYLDIFILNTMNIIYSVLDNQRNVV